MKRHSRAGRAYALSAFFAVSGVVLALAVAFFTIRHLVLAAPNTQTWSAWTTGALASLGALAIALWVAGAVLAIRVHHARRDRVVTFLKAAERQRVLDAVAMFESRTSGEIRVHLAERSGDDPTRAAVEAFERLGMTRTRDRNGVLIYVSVRDHGVAVVGDAGIHERVPRGFWSDVVRAIEVRFAESRFAEGLVDGIAMAGTRLAEHFPPRPDDRNELPDSLSDDTR
ncbi:MAG TPA: TPM domain-containing protein [Candidatus Krumholzibacteria bacterium]